MSKLILALILLASTPLFADPAGDALSPGEWRLDLRHETRYAAENSLDETLRYRHPLTSWLDADTGVRLSQTKINLASIQYKVGLIVSPFEFFSLEARLSHAARFSEGLAYTNYSVLAVLKSTFSEIWEGYLGAGWYQRHVTLPDSGILPVFAGSYALNQYILLMGNRVRLTEEWKVNLWAATIEGFDTFNMHNPVGEFAISYGGLGPLFTLHTYMRYRVFLGFGRRDTLLFGFGLSYRT